MIVLVDVVEVRALDERRLWLRFSDGTEGEHDFSELLDRDWPMVRPLKDPEMFKRVFVSAFGVPTWPNGFDVDAIQLHREMSEQGRLHRSAA
ncbi:MAG: DUF2442 domain-containing protein [Rhizobiaceae bacterium]|nr:DUF2442 domain-containing protein [Rhizobiaceae bacterium]